MSAFITTNGRMVKVGHTINIIQGKIISDGEVVEEFDEPLVIEKIEGEIGKLECHYPIIVHGDVKGNLVSYSPVYYGDVGGHLKAEGPVNCGDVQGSVKTTGPVNCGDIKGNLR